MARIVTLIQQGSRLLFHTCVLRSCGRLRWAFRTGWRSLWRARVLGCRRVRDAGRCRAKLRKGEVGGRRRPAWVPEHSRARPFHAVCWGSLAVRNARYDGAGDSRPGDFAFSSSPRVPSADQRGGRLGTPGPSGVLTIHSQEVPPLVQGPSLRPMQAYFHGFQYSGVKSTLKGRTVVSLLPVGTRFHPLARTVQPPQ